MISMSSPHILILSAGKGTRMKSQTPKVLHPVAGRPMIEYVLDVAFAAAPETCTVVVGHGADAVRQALAHRTASGQAANSLAAAAAVRFLLQEPKLGTGHALIQA